jgi:PEGA domain
MFPTARFPASIAGIVCSIAALPTVLVAQTSAVELPRFTKETAKAAVNYWKESNKLVKIDRSAARSVQAAFTAPRQFERPRLSNPLTESADDFVIGCYLDELRDRRYLKMGSPAVSKNPKISLTSTDVEDFSIATFAAGLPPDIWPHPGELTVLSFPPGASISIDGVPRGNTNKDFVVSKGKHDIVVHLEKQTCDAAVLVVDDLFVFRCPKNGKPSPPKHNASHPR